MYLSASHIANLPIISLQTGETAGWAKQPVIQLSNFEICGYLCDAAQGRKPLVLMATDIRQIASDCIIVDNEEELTDPADIVRLRSTLDEAYSPIGKTVVAESGQRLGSVEDFTINVETSRIQKLYVRQSLIKAWLGQSLTIDRLQIIDVTPKRITVRDAMVEVPIMPPKSVVEPHT